MILGIYFENYNHIATVKNGDFCEFLATLTGPRLELDHLAPLIQPTVQISQKSDR